MAWKVNVDITCVFSGLDGSVVSFIPVLLTLQPCNWTVLYNRHIPLIDSVASNG